MVSIPAGFALGNKDNYNDELCHYYFNLLSANGALNRVVNKEGREMVLSPASRQRKKTITKT